MTRYLAGVAPSVAHAAEDFWRAWNDGREVGTRWSALEAVLPELGSHARAWSMKMQASGDLAGNLVRFCKVEIE